MSIVNINGGIPYDLQFIQLFRRLESCTIQYTLTDINDKYNDKY